MDNIQQFARECAAFFKKSLFTPNAKATDVDLGIDVTIAILARLDATGMGTTGPGSPHEELLHYLRKRPLSQEVTSVVDSLI
jgi:hypothetical protein